MAHFAAQVSVHVLLCATVMIMKKTFKDMAPTPNESLNFFLFAYTALALWTATARVCDLCDAGFAAVLLLMSLMATIARMPCFTAPSKQISVGPLTLDPEFSGFSSPDCLESSNDNKIMSNCGSSNGRCRTNDESDCGSIVLNSDVLRNRLEVLRRQKRRTTCSTTTSSQRSLFASDDDKIIPTPTKSRVRLQSLMIDDNDSGSCICSIYTTYMFIFVIYA